MILNHIAGQCPVNNKAIAMTHINSYIKRGVQRKKLYALIFFYIKKMMMMFTIHTTYHHCL